MKGYAAASSPLAKRRWKGLAIAVLVLGFFSLLVPLAFLLGLQNRFPSGNLSDERSSSESGFENYARVDAGGEQNESEGDELRVNDLMDRFKATIPEDVTVNFTKKPTTESVAGVQSNSRPKDALSYSKPKNSTSRGLPTEQVVVPKAPSSLNTRNDGRDGKENHSKDSAGDETEKSCQHEFGSYCIWSKEHKEVMKDALVKRLKDQLFVARAYYPSIAKLQGQEKLSLELKQSIQEHERMLSEAISDADLPSFVGKKIQNMDHTIAEARSCTIDCNNVDKKLRQILDLTEDEAHFHMKQSAFLYHLGVQTMPKSLHCLSMRLTVEYFKNSLEDIEQFHAYKLNNPIFQHYVLISRNILAVSVTINSTVMNAEETGHMIFHLVTDGQNFYAMKHWFARNSYKEATVHVLNFDNLNLIHSYNLGLRQLSPSEEFRVSISDVAQSSSMRMRTEYLSVFGHSHFLLPEIFKNLKKVVVLDDDVVVQRDLSSLWNLDLEGKVNGAVQFCGVRLGQLKTYIGGYNYNGDSCAWMSGMNIVDLESWREHNITGNYLRLLQKFQNGTEASWRASALPISLLAFQDLIYTLDDTWVQSRLGHDYGVSADAIKNAAALHYNGNMKPWLELGIPKYKSYWKKFLTQEERFMAECNVNP
ncbi:probable galacturonosyltransferase 7 isoform X1 [Elaeis guineensis]|uniref:Hexosyltransferase n=1 Tax=Elaeis guineensis var. tenera TaxID=51953 RepID=A0A6I9RS13_ELAGV|nr:probable galacturonosyltransferase 7 isoform X1 [Elaeis guineensis]